MNCGCCENCNSPITKESFDFGFCHFCWNPIPFDTHEIVGYLVGDIFDDHFECCNDCDVPGQCSDFGCLKKYSIPKNPF